MIASASHRAVLDLERRAAARLAAVNVDLQRLGKARDGIIASAAQARGTLFGRTSCSGFEIAALAIHMVRAATAAAELSDAQRDDRALAAKLSAERLHWARCRRGLERRGGRWLG
jgi:hypothetical protein